MQVEDLRLLLSQQKGVTVLVPLALAKFEQNPLTEGDFYPGDLLTTILRIPQPNWQQAQSNSPVCNGSQKRSKSLGISMTTRHLTMMFGSKSTTFVGAFRFRSASLAN
jgi:hypothetical protein